MERGGSFRLQPIEPFESSRVYVLEPLGGGFPQRVAKSSLADVGPLFREAARQERRRSGLILRSREASP
jgi:hypothetical protein